MAQVVKFLPQKHEDLSFDFHYLCRKLAVSRAVAAHAFDPST